MAIRSVGDLLTCDLLYMEAQRPSWIGWQQWLRHFGRDVADRGQSMGSDNYYNTIQACLAGQGVALGWLRLPRDPLASGQLVRPMEQCLETGEQDCLAWPEAREPACPTEAFEAWLRYRFGGPIETNLARPG